MNPTASNPLSILTGTMNAAVPTPTSVQERTR
ncbi:MAG: hypothetical protein JWM87_813 [Candidatus Eremiobacteraeota bacterium]|nr:hypothetical protein [Candidatus Eremiobacteraeota bacterium]